MASFLIHFLEKLGFTVKVSPQLADNEIMRLLFNQYLVDAEISSVLALAAQSADINRFLDSEASASFWKKRLKRDQPSTYTTLRLRGEFQQHIIATLQQGMNVYKAFYMRNLRFSVLVSNMDHITVPDENIRHVPIMSGVPLRQAHLSKRTYQRYFMFRGEDGIYIVDWTLQNAAPILLENPKHHSFAPSALSELYAFFRVDEPFSFSTYNLAEGRWTPDLDLDISRELQLFRQRPAPRFSRLSPGERVPTSKENVIDVQAIPNQTEGYLDIKQYVKILPIASDAREISESCLVIEPLRQLKLQIGGYLSYQVQTTQSRWYSPIVDWFRSAPEEFTVVFQRIGKETQHEIPRKLLQNYAGPIPTGIGKFITNIDESGNITLISLKTGSIRPAPRPLINKSFRSIPTGELLEYNALFHFSDMILWAKFEYMYYLQGDGSRVPPVFVITKHRSATTVAVSETFMESLPKKASDYAMRIRVVAFSGTHILLQVAFWHRSGNEKYYSLSIEDSVEEEGARISSAFGSITAKQCVWCTLETDDACQACDTPYCGEACQAEDWIGHQKHCQLLSDLH